MDVFCWQLRSLVGAIGICVFLLSFDTVSAQAQTDGDGANEPTTIIETERGAGEDRLITSRLQAIYGEIEALNRCGFGSTKESSS